MWKFSWGMCGERCPAEHVKIPSKRTTINQRRRPWPSSSKCVREKELFRKHVLVSFCCALLLEFLHRPRDRRQWNLFFDESCILSASLFLCCCVHGTFISFTCCLLLVRSSMICVDAVSIWRPESHLLPALLSTQPELHSSQKSLLARTKFVRLNF